MKEEELKQFIERWMCELGNTDDPLRAEKAIQHRIRERNLCVSPESIALGKVEALFAILTKLV